MSTNGSPIGIQSCLTSKVCSRSEANDLSNADASSRPGGRDRDGVHVDVMFFLFDNYSIERESCRKGEQYLNHSKQARHFLASRKLPHSLSHVNRDASRNLHQPDRCCQPWTNQISLFLPYLELKCSNSEYALPTICLQSDVFKERDRRLEE